MNFLYSTSRYSLVAIILIPFILAGQNDQVEFYRHELRKAKTDTSIIFASAKLAFHLKDINPDSSRLLCSQASRLLPRVTDPIAKFETYRKVGQACQSIRLLDSALWLFGEAEKQSVLIKDKWRQGVILNNIGGLYREKKELENALISFEKALNINKDINDKEGQTVNYNNIAIIYTDLKSYDEAVENYEQAMDLQQELGNKEYEAAISWNLGLLLSKEDFQSAIPYFKKAIDLKGEINDLEGQTIIMQDLANKYYRRNYIPQALEYYQQAVINWRKLGNKRNLAKLLSQIANAHTKIEDFSKALPVLKEKLKLHEDLKDTLEISRTLNNIGYNYKLLEKYEEALPYFYLSLENYYSHSHLTGSILPEFNIGSIHQQLSNLDSASYYLEPVLLKSKQNKNSYIQLLASQELGQLYVKTEQSQKAMTVLNEALNVYNGPAYINERIQVYQLLYEISKRQNKSTQALAYLERYAELKDSSINEENTKAYTRFTAQYEFDKEKEQLAQTQEKEIQTFTQKLQRQRTLQLIFAIILSLSLISAFILARYYRLKQRSNKKLQELNDELSSKNDLVARQKENLTLLDQAKTKLYTNITHEFRTPLTVISGIASQLEGNDTKKELISRNSHQLLNLVNQMLDLRKIESGSVSISYQQSDIIQYFRYLTESFKGLANDNKITLHLIADEDQIVMDFDYQKILRVHTNLLSNAIKFTPSGGNIYIQLSSMNEAGKEQLLYIVRDTGVGIAEEKQAHIFEQFYQVDDGTTRQHEGTGIGLTLVSELVKAMNGKIGVKSKEGKGTTFSVVLPKTNVAEIVDIISLRNEPDSNLFIPVSHLQKSEDIASPQQTASSEKPTVLIVEDNADVIHYLMACLKEEYHLEIAMNGNEGIEKALEDIPDLIISDVMMPIKDGFELCHTLKTDERTSHIPIILLTAKADVDSRMEGLTRGADAYLSKPFHQQELVQILKNQLTIRSRLQEYLIDFSKRTKTVDTIEMPDDQQTSIQQQLETEDAFLQKIRMIIETDLTNHDISMPQLIRKLKMSRSQIYKKVKALTSLSPSRYIRSIRLFHAKQLLELTKLNVSEIAYEVGFTSPTYFSDVFFEEYGLRPNAYRNRTQENDEVNT